MTCPGSSAPGTAAGRNPGSIVATALAAALPNISAKDRAAIAEEMVVTVRKAATQTVRRMRWTIASELETMIEAPGMIMLALAHHEAESVARTEHRLFGELGDAIRSGTAGPQPITIRETVFDWMSSPAVARKADRAVAEELLGALAATADLPPTILAALESRIAKADAGIAPHLADARRLSRLGELTEASLLAASAAGDAARVQAMLATASDVPPAVVANAAALRDSKGLLSLAWQAGFSMRAAVALQVIVGEIEPDAIIRPARGGAFPLSEAEMRWQIEFLARSARVGP